MGAILLAMCMASHVDQMAITFPSVGEECYAESFGGMGAVVVDAPISVPECRAWFVSPAVCVEFQPLPGESSPLECARRPEPCKAGVYWFDVVNPVAGATVMFTFKSGDIP